MSIEIMAQVWMRAPVEQGELLVLLALADYAGEDRRCYPGIPTLAKRARLSERQVKSCLASLRDRGVIEVARNASPVKTNIYRITDQSRWMGENCTSAASPDVQSEAARGEAHFPSDGKPTSPEPSVTPEEEPSGSSCDLFEAKGPEKETPKVDPFPEFWALYPNVRKVGKPQAREAFMRIVDGKQKGFDATPAATLIAALKAFVDDKTLDPAYTPAPLRWLTNGYWERYVGATAAPKADYSEMIITNLAAYYGAKAALSGRQMLDQEFRNKLDVAQQLAAGMDEAAKQALVVEAKRRAGLA